jgi:hypothetical protein
MNGKTAKRLRKQANYQKPIETELAGDYNLTVATGSAQRVINVKRYVLKEPTEEQQEAKTAYKELKKSYK